MGATSTDGFNPRVLKFCAWSGVAFFFLWPLAAWLVTGGVYIPPPSAADTAAKTVGDYTENIVGMRIAATIMIFASMFYLTWGMAVAMLQKKLEGDYPVLFYVQVVALAACVVVVMLIGYFWAAAAWRAGDTLPTVTQAFNDLGWLGVLFTGAPFAVYQLAMAAVTLVNKSERPIYPRWSAYFNIFVSIFMFEAAGILFFKTGPFSQNGVMVFWVPMIVFFGWMIVFSVLALRAINAEVRERTGGSEAIHLERTDPLIGTG